MIGVKIKANAINISKINEFLIPINSLFTSKFNRLDTFLPRQCRTKKPRHCYNRTLSLFVVPFRESIDLHTCLEVLVTLVVR